MNNTPAADAHAALGHDTLFLKQTAAVGLGVFARQTIAADEIVLTFSGPIVSAAEVQDHSAVIAIGNRLFRGRSGGLDDFLNHSCEPNCGLVDPLGSLSLMTLREITPGEELTWDYSTANCGEWALAGCRCNAATCRRVIGAFRELPRATQDRYIGAGIVPTFVLDDLVRSLSGNPGRRHRKG